MRTRTLGPVMKTVSGGLAYHASHCTHPERVGTSPSYSPDSSGWELTTRKEVMTDEESPRPPCGFKPCDHTKMRLNWCAPARFIEGHKCGTQGTITWNIPAGTAVECWLPGVKSHLDGLSWDDGDLEFTHDDFWRMSHAWEVIKPQIEPEMDLLVFLAEADELPKLAMSLKEKLTKFLSATSDDVARYLNGLSVIEDHLGARDMLRVFCNEAGDALSSQWLEYNFAIAPLVDDLIGFVNGILSFDAKVRELLDGAGKPQKAHASFATDWYPEPDILAKVDDCDICGARGYEGGCQYPPADGSYEQAKGNRARVLYPGGASTRIGMTVFYRYELPAWAQDFAWQVNALAASLGINPGLGTIWELIPFSFVLDWFWPVGKLLSQAKLEAFPVKTEILDICFTKRTTRPFLIQGRAHVCPLNTDRSYASGELETFRRVVGPDHLTKIPSFRWPNWFQLSLGASLAQGLRDWRSRA